MTSRPYSRSSDSGFTLIELLVALTVTATVTAAALTLVLSGRRLYDTDRERTSLNQSLRAAKDFLSVDIRQAGERLGDDFPALEIVRGEDLPGGAAGDPDELIVRRNLVATVMRSCRDVGGGGDIIYISESVFPPPPGCVPVPDGDGDGWPDNHKVWADYREANGVELDSSKYVWAYLYNPASKQGEFFRYWADVPAAGQITTPVGQTWSFSYPASDRPRVYLLEQRRYRIVGGTLELIVNGLDTEPIVLADGVEDFQLRAHFRSGPPQDSLGPADPWSDLRAIEVALEGGALVDGRIIERRVSTMVTPRNVLSF